jgi:hypothetical protein
MLAVAMKFAIAAAAGREQLLPRSELRGSAASGGHEPGISMPMYLYVARGGLMASRIPALPRDSHVQSHAAVHKNELCDSHAHLVARGSHVAGLDPYSACRASPLSGDTTSLICVARINRYTVPIGVLYAKKMMSKKSFIRDLSCCDSPTD